MAVSKLPKFISSFPVKDDSAKLIDAVVKLIHNHHKKSKFGKTLASIRLKHRKVNGIHEIEGYTAEWKYDKPKVIKGKT